MRNDKARRYLTSMRKKQPVPFSQKFPNADPLALRLLEKLLAFDPRNRPTAEEVCYFLYGRKNRYVEVFCMRDFFWEFRCLFLFMKCYLCLKLSCSSSGTS